MKINTDFVSFKKKHLKKNNQIIYHEEKFKNKQIIDNLVQNFLREDNSFVFESVEKGKIRGRYTIFGKKPDKKDELPKHKIMVYEKKHVFHSLPIIDINKINHSIIWSIKAISFSPFSLFVYFRILNLFKHSSTSEK